MTYIQFIVSNALGRAVNELDIFENNSPVTVIMNDLDDRFSNYGIAIEEDDFSGYNVKMDGNEFISADWNHKHLRQYSLFKIDGKFGTEKLASMSMRVPPEVVCGYFGDIVLNDIKGNLIDD